MHKEFEEKYIILFGCGQAGYQVLNLLGAENILCFCDNNKELQGTNKWGKRIYSLEQIKMKYKNYTIVICAAPAKAYKIAKQLDNEDIFDYWLYPIIKQKIENLSGNEIKKLLCDSEIMLSFRILAYKKRMSELEKQVDYMRQHADIKTMKPAKGELRKRQMALTDLGEFVCRALEKFQIKPFLCGGCLLGYVRNHGFIPWDDDMDFELIREEYERLYQYCLIHQDTDGRVPFQYNGRIEKLKFIQKHNLFKLIRELPGQPDEWLEFFSLDYYADNYPFETFREDAKRIRSDAVYKFNSMEEKVNYIKDEMKKNPFIVQQSNFIFYGFDNQESVRLYDRGKMMPKEIIFPLQLIEFEGKKFWIPNDPEEFLSYNFHDIWVFPDDVGLQEHTCISEA